MSLRHILLGVLQKPKSGYDIKKMFDEVFSNFWAAELSQIYPQLKKMTEAGWLCVTDEVSAKGPNKKIYQTTGQGKKELLKWLAKGPLMHTEKLSYLAQIYFLDGLKDKQERVVFMQKLLTMMQDWHANLRGIEKEWRSCVANFPQGLPDEDFYPYLTLSMGEKKIGAIIEWVEESLVLIKHRA